MKQLTFAISEIKISYKILILGIMISAEIISTSLIFYNLTGYIMPGLVYRYDAQYEDMVDVNLNNLKIRNADILDNYQTTKVNLTVYSAKCFYSSKFFLKDGTQLPNGYISTGWVTDGSDVSGIKLDKSFNYSNNVVVIQGNDDNRVYHMGDEITVHNQDDEFVGTFKVIGISKDAENDQTTFYMPASTIIESYEKQNFYIDYEFSCNFKKVSEYIDARSSLLNHGIICVSQFDRIFDLVTTLNTLFVVMTVIFVVLSVCAIAAISIIHINTREKMVVLYKVLGMTSGRIVLIYSIILEFQMIISNIIGNILGYVLTKHLITVVCSAFDINASIDTGIGIWSALIPSILISQVALIPFLMVITARINQSDVVAVINNKE